MDIPFYYKANPSDVTCAPVCLRMALAYYGLRIELDHVYQIAHSMGACHYTIPWGMCLGAAEMGLYAIFVSRSPNVLLQMYIDRIAAIANMPIEQVGSEVECELAECRANDKITLVEWEEPFSSVPGNIVAVEAGVVIPTVWWGDVDAHNIVLTHFDAHHVSYHDPNFPTGRDQRMSADDFFQMWHHENTDNDLLIISRNELNLQEFTAEL